MDRAQREQVLREQGSRVQLYDWEENDLPEHESRRLIKVRAQDARTQARTAAKAAKR
jgi:hypothetical protein